MTDEHTLKYNTSVPNMMLDLPIFMGHTGTQNSISPFVLTCTMNTRQLG